MSDASVGQASNLDSVLPRAHRGDLAFLEYSIIHWLHHVRSLPDKDDAVTPEFREILKLSLGILENEKCYGSSPVRHDINLEGDDGFEDRSWHLVGVALDAQNSSHAFARCPQTNLETPPQCLSDFPSTTSDMDTDADIESLPISPVVSDTSTRDETQDQGSASLLRLANCRSAIETAMDQPSANRDLLLSAFGRRPFKCPIVACRRFHYGFPRRKERDSHVEAHARFKCKEMSCDYRLLGFSSQGALKMHTSLYHCNDSDQITFPNLQPQSIWESLELAIDKGDSLVVKQLCVEAKYIPERPKGFVLRALERR